MVVCKKGYGGGREQHSIEHHDALSARSHDTRERRVPTSAHDTRVDVAALSLSQSTTRLPLSPPMSSLTLIPAS